jgi:TPR repeat protein
MKMFRHLAMAAVLALVASTAAAQDAHKGWTSWEAGDFQSALQEWLPIANQKDVNVQILLELGHIYKDGKGVPKDYGEAVKWYRLASIRGEAYAQYSLGFMYMQGWGVLQDNVQAHMWFNIAAANGDVTSGNWRDEISARMTLETIAKAQAMASECMSSGYKNCGEL